MKAVKTIQKYKCDFCKKRGIKSSIERHEKICFRNTDRFCTLCQNTGEVSVVENEIGYYEPCFYCAKFDAQQLKEIEAREKGEKVEPLTEVRNLPF